MTELERQRPNGGEEVTRQMAGRAVRVGGVRAVLVAEEALLWTAAGQLKYSKQQRDEVEAWVRG